MEADFSGYATRNGLKCSDGRTIMADAFKHNDKQKVPLVWQHQQNDPVNILGHAVLENRKDGVYAYAYFNDTDSAQNAKSLVKHGDITALSIYANNLKQKGGEVFHGNIRELSLVLSGANPGAFIDNVNLSHGDGSYEEVEDEAIIYTGEDLQHENQGETMGNQEPEIKHEAPAAEKTVKDVFEELTEEQKNVVYFMIGEALEGGTDEEGGNEEEAQHGYYDNGEILQHIQEGFDTMTHNIFEQAGAASTAPTLTHSQVRTIVADAIKGGSLKESALAHADEYGITDINLMFPDAKAVSSTPEFLSRRMEWVDTVLSGTKHSPFARIKSLVADITAEEARAKGYVKGNMKKDEVIGLLRRTTSPATVYKKQKLDRDDILDITDFDVVTWLQAEIRLMLEEEIARAILVGDGRSASSEDKIKDPAGSTDGTGIRSILHDNDLYAHKADLAANTSPRDAVKGLIRARSFYRGSGKPDLFISDSFLTDIMLEEDKFQRPLYETEQALADKLRVGKIITVDLFDDHEDLFAIMVNLADYTIGANKGGELTSFEDFDIDFNQNKYLMETRLSGALTKPKSAVVVRRLQGTAVVPTAPSFNGATNTITVPTVTGVVYTVDGDPVSGSVVITEDTEVTAVPDDEFYFAPNTTVNWNFTYTA